MNASEQKNPLPRDAGICLAILLLLAVFSLWTWQKWETVWVDRSADFFPPELVDAKAAPSEAWLYPVYRSNDTYEWVRMADELVQENTGWPLHRMDEGPLQEGRGNAWHSGLGHLLAQTGTWQASRNQWETERGIRHSAHWLGGVLLFILLVSGSATLLVQGSRWSALAFLLLAYFHPSIQWDFSFSRLDHESVFQIAFLLQLLGLVGILLNSERDSMRWGLLAAIGSGFGWWIGSTMQAICGAILVAGCTVSLFGEKPSTKQRSALLFWGLGGSSLMFLLGLLDGRWPPGANISAWHPVYALAQIGAGLFCAGWLWQNKTSRRVALSSGLLLGLAPIIWLLLHSNQSVHVWLDPFMRRLHSTIVEFQSPFSNSLWKEWSSIASVLCGFVALPLLFKRSRIRPLFIILLAGLLALTLLQTRWLGLFSTASILAISLHLRKPRLPYCLTLGLLGTVLVSLWVQHWQKIETEPSRLFKTDLYLQTGARDINLNLAHYTKEKDPVQPTAVVLPFGFAASTALFEQIHALGTFYWENQLGLLAASEIYASNDDATAYALCKKYEVKYIVVQRLQLGNPFAQLAHTAAGSDQPLESTLAWRLAHGIKVPDWCAELPFYGTFDPRILSARIYRVAPLQVHTAGTQ
ncbi:MAG: hypothetical protein ACON46_03185 [Coraliomargaritaceae bacterium]